MIGFNRNLYKVNKKSNGKFVTQAIITGSITKNKVLVHGYVKQLKKSAELNNSVEIPAEVVNLIAQKFWKEYLFYNFPENKCL